MVAINHRSEIMNGSPEKIELEEGEIICDKCGGSGIDPQFTKNYTYFHFPFVCPKCQGEKKLDWISKITGVAPKTSNSSNYAYTLPSHTHTVPNPAIKSAAQAIVSQIDKEIIESYKAVTEQKNKKWRKIFGNRIISKLLLFCNS